MVHITAGSNGLERVAGARLTAFYLMPPFEIDSIDGDLCMDKGRGIIECIIGILEENEEVRLQLTLQPDNQAGQTLRQRMFQALLKNRNIRTTT